MTIVLIIVLKSKALAAFAIAVIILRVAAQYRGTHFKDPPLTAIL